MSESEYYIDTFHFFNSDGRLYITGLDGYALHYDLECNYDVINALIDFNRPHAIKEIDFTCPKNTLHKDIIEVAASKGHLNYPTWSMNEKGVKTLYKLINGKELDFNYSHKNFVENCEITESFQQPAEITSLTFDGPLQKNFTKPIPVNKTNNCNRGNPDYNNWRQSVLKRDDFKCVVCGDIENLEAHHMYGYKENPNLATETSNGITLCKWCHKKYHSKYGLKNINPVDFVKFIKRFGVR